MEQDNLQSELWSNPAQCQKQISRHPKTRFSKADCTDRLIARNPWHYQEEIVGENETPALATSLPPAV